MFDAVVISPADPEPAARTFTGLVEGVVDGMVRRVVLLSPQDGDGLHKLADAAGCRLLTAVPAAAMGAALKDVLETPHVLVLGAGALLPPGWSDLLRHEFQRRGAPGAAGGIAFKPAGVTARLRLAMAITLRGRLALGHGVLAATPQVTEKSFDGVTCAPNGPWRLAKLRVERMR